MAETNNHTKGKTDILADTRMAFLTLIVLALVGLALVPTASAETGSCNNYGVGVYVSSDCSWQYCEASSGAGAEAGASTGGGGSGAGAAAGAGTSCSNNGGGNPTHSVKDAPTEVIEAGGALGVGR